MSLCIYYNGQVGNERMSLAMEWTGQSSFVEQPLKDWVVGDHVAGLTRSAKGLTFATIHGAGHMVSIFMVLDKILVNSSFSGTL